MHQNVHAICIRVEKLDLGLNHVIFLTEMGVQHCTMNSPPRPLNAEGAFVLAPFDHDPWSQLI